MLNYKELQIKFPSLFDNHKAPIKIVTDDNAILFWQAKRRESLVQNGEPLNWADIGIVLEDPYVTVIRDLVQFPGGSKNGYIRLINRADLEGGQAVAVLPIFEEKIQLIYRSRHATRSWHFEVPRGFGESNTSAEQQARDEVKEEIGGETEKIIDLGILHNNTGIEGNNVQLFLAYLTAIGIPQKNEAIAKITHFTLKELESMIANNEITDSFTIAAYTRAKLLGLLDQES